MFLLFFEEESLAAVSASSGTDKDSANNGRIGSYSRSHKGPLVLHTPADTNSGTTYSSAPSTPFVSATSPSFRMPHSPVPSSASTHTSNASSSSTTINNLIVAELQEEKRQLLHTLKTYERDFVKQQGRPVTKHEDIAPVASEYKRYKEIKGILHES
jgi:hypothetical protein